MPVIDAVVPVVQPPPLTCHSMCTGDPASAAAVSGTVTAGPFCQLVVGAAVVLLGCTESIRTQSSSHAVHVFVTLSWTRCVKRLMPSPMTGAVPLKPATGTGVPQLIEYCIWSTTTGSPVSGTSTVPGGVPCSHAPEGFVVSRPPSAVDGRSVSVGQPVAATAADGQRRHERDGEQDDEYVKPRVHAPVIGRLNQTCSSAVPSPLKTRTASGSKSVPAPRAISSTAASSVQDSLYGTLVQEHVEDVGEMHQPGRDRDRVSGQPGGIPAAVPALVVVAGDRLGGAQQVGAAVGEHARAHRGVAS